MNVKRRAPARAMGGAEDRPLDWPGDPESLTAEAVDFEALAHVLANTCRRGGRLKRFHSLAAHAVTMSEAIEDLGGPGGGRVREAALYALLAEASVAWLGADAAHSLRPTDRMRRLCGRVEAAVLEAAGLERRTFCGTGGAFALHRPDGGSRGGARRPRSGRGRGHVRRLPAARPPHQATRSRPCGAALARSFPRPQETAGRGRERRSAPH